MVPIYFFGLPMSVYVIYLLFNHLFITEDMTLHFKKGAMYLLKKGNKK